MPDRAKDVRIRVETSLSAASLLIVNKIAYLDLMTDSAQQRKSRLAKFAQDALGDVRLSNDAEVVLARTARLRAERLGREVITPLAPKDGRFAPEKERVNADRDRVLQRGMSC